MKKLIFLSLISFFSFELHAQKELIVFSEDNELFLANLNSDNLAKKVSNFFEFTNVNFETTVLEITLDNNQKLKKTISLKENTTIYSITNVDDNYKIEYRGNYNLDEELPQFEFTKNIFDNPGVTIDYSLISVEKQKLAEEEAAEETEDSEGVKVVRVVAVVEGGEVAVKEVDEKVGVGAINDVEEPVKSKEATEVAKEEEGPVKPKVVVTELAVAGVIKEEEEPVKPKVVATEVAKEEEEIDRATNKLVNINIILDAIEGLSDDKSRTKIMVKELNKGKYNCRQLKFLFTKITSDYSKLYTFKSTVNSCLDKNNLMTLKSSFKTKKYKTEYVKLVSKL